MRAVYFLLLILAFASGCGRKESGPQAVAFDDWNRAKNFASQFFVDCPSGNCNPSVGILFNTYKEESICTASVVGHQNGEAVVMTNRHCIERLNGSSELCRGNVYVRFNTNDQPLRGGTCSQIIAQSSRVTSNETINQGVDFAFFTIKGLANARALTLQQRPVQDSEKVTIHYVLRDEVVGRDGTAENILHLSQIQCPTIMGSMANLAYDNPYSATVTTHGCALKGGASGSPVMDKNDHVIGVLHGGYAVNPVRVLFESMLGGVMGELNLHIAMRVNQQNIFSRLGCIEAPSLSLKVDNPQACAVTSGKMPGVKFRESGEMDDALKSIQVEADKWLESNSKIVGFVPELLKEAKAKVVDGSLIKPMVSFKPTCIMPANSWIEPYKKKTAYFYTTYPENLQLSYTVPTWHFVYGYDEYLRPVLDVQRVNRQVRVAISPKEFASKRESYVRVFDPTSEDHWEVAILPQRFSECRVTENHQDK